MSFNAFLKHESPSKMTETRDLLKLNVVLLRSNEKKVLQKVILKLITIQRK